MAALEGMGAGGVADGHDAVGKIGMVECVDENGGHSKENHTLLPTGPVLV